MHPNPFASLLWALPLLACLAQAQPAFAQESPDIGKAASHFAAGEAAFRGGDFVTAGREFEAANAAAPEPSALWNAARSWHEAGEHPRAANLYRAYLEVAPADAIDRDAATRAVVELASRLGRIAIVAPSTHTLTIDQQPVQPGPWFVHPGSHLVLASQADERLSQVVTVAAGQTITVTLEPPQPMTPVVPSRPNPEAAQLKTSPRETPPTSAAGWSPWLLMPFAGTTLLSGGLAIASGIDTLIAQDQYLEIPAADRTLDLYDQGKFKQDRTNVLIGVTAGLSLTTLLVGVLAIDWGEGALVAIGPNELWIHGRF